MKRATKFLVLLLCASICAGGAMLSVKGDSKADRPKSNVLPIENREPHHGVWIWA